MSNVHITPDMALAPRHWHAFRERWPAGWELWCGLAYEVLMADEGFTAHIDAMAPADMMLRNRVIEAELRARPISRQLSPLQLKVTFEAVAAQVPALWVTDVCALCERYLPGCDYPRVQRGAGCACGHCQPPPPTETTHLCLECIATAPDAVFLEPEQFQQPPNQ